MKKYLAIGAVALAAALGAPTGSAIATSPVATASCSYYQTPGGLKCLAAGEFCSHKPGYAAAYRRAGYYCKRNGHLEYL